MKIQPGIDNKLLSVMVASLRAKESADIKPESFKPNFGVFKSLDSWESLSKKLRENK